MTNGDVVVKTAQHGHEGYNISNLLGKILVFWSLTAFSSLSHGGYYDIYEHIVLTQDLSISAHRLCQDGLYVYFNSKETCERADVQFDCQGSLRITPLYDVEKVALKVGGPSITRFYKVQTNFAYKTFETKEGSLDRMVSRTPSSIPMCPGKDIYETQTVGEFRYVNSDSEAMVVESLVDSNFDIINTPRGSLDEVLNPSYDDIEPVDFTRKKPVVKSPYCGDGAAERADLLHLLGGEYSGDGVEKANLTLLQSYSSQLFIKTTEYVNTVNGEKTKRRLNFHCVKTWDI